MDSSNIDNKIKTEMLMEIIFEERKNNHADEYEKKKNPEMVAMIKRVIEKGVRKDEVQKNAIN